MKKNKKIKLAGALLGAALSSSSLVAHNTCGAGKCGTDSKKVKVEDEMSGNAGKKTQMTCAAVKCGANMNQDTQVDEMSGNSGKKTQMACGAGKCGSEMMKTK